MNDWLAAADILVTDYSSSIFEWALLRRPLVLLVDDLEAYERDPGLYLDYRTEMIGTQVRDTAGVAAAIAAGDWDLDAYEAFVARQPRRVRRPVERPDRRALHPRARRDARTGPGFGTLTGMATKIILDVDTGTDDAVALMTAALSPDLELVGATVVNGNTVLDSCVENTLRVFEWIGMPEIPVFRGMSRPIARSQAAHNPATRIHGDKLDLPEATITAQPQHAVDWLIDTYLASDGDITLVPVGPLTNIAMAIQKEPRIVERIPEIVIMGGAHDHGNATASAEFNIWLDPEAARIVVNCGRPIRMVPLDATHRALVSLEDATRLQALGTPAGEAAYRFISKRIEGYDATQPMHRTGAAPVHDALAVCAIIDPSVITTRFAHVDVETSGELTLGRTVCDFRFSGRTPAEANFAFLPPNVEFALDADEPKFVAMLLDILGRTA